VCPLSYYGGHMPTKPPPDPAERLARVKEEVRAEVEADLRARQAAVAKAREAVEAAQAEFEEAIVKAAAAIGPTAVQRICGFKSRTAVTRLIPAVKGAK